MRLLMREEQLTHIVCIHIDRWLLGPEHWIVEVEQRVTFKSDDDRHAATIDQVCSKNHAGCPEHRRDVVACNEGSMT